MNAKFTNAYIRHSASMDEYAVLWLSIIYFFGQYAYTMIYKGIIGYVTITDGLGEVTPMTQARIVHNMTEAN